MIPQWLAISLAVVGFMFAANAWKGRNLPDVPEGVEPGAPASAWPKHLRKDRLAYELGRNWKPWLVGGVIVGAFGAVSAIATIIGEFREAIDEEPSSAELVDALVDAPDSTFDRGEAECLVDLMDSLGIDPVADDDVQVARLGQLIGRMTDAQLARIESCFDDESLAAMEGRTLSRLDDEELRTLTVEALHSSPEFRVSRAQAECWVDTVIAAGMLREFLGVSQSGELPSPALDATMLAADDDCLR